MSFTSGGSGPESLLPISFRPTSLSIDWDGISEAKASFDLACYDTAATYSAVAFPVYTSSGSVSVGPTTSPTVFRWQKGDRRGSPYQFGSEYFWSFAQNVSIPTTVASSVATVRFSAITATYFSHAWQLTGTKGTATRVLVAGGVFIKPPNPYDGGSSQVFAGGVTASGCF